VRRQLEARSFHLTALLKQGPHCPNHMLGGGLPQPAGYDLCLCSPRCSRCFPHGSLRGNSHLLLPLLPLLPGVQHCSRRGKQTGRAGLAWGPLCVYPPRVRLWAFRREEANLQTPGGFLSGEIELKGRVCRWCFPVHSLLCKDLAAPQILWTCSDGDGSTAPRVNFSPRSRHPG
jgi:hypothetical protein